jgi:Nsp1-like C-terminal region
MDPATTAAAGASLSTPLPSISLIQNKSIEAIIYKFAASLDSHLDAFSRQAHDIAAWDTALVSQGEQVKILTYTLYMTLYLSVSVFLITF